MAGMNTVWSLGPADCGVVPVLVRISISYRSILCHHAPGDGPGTGGGAVTETPVAFLCSVRSDEKVSHGGSQ
jgi:hypothetical protein